MAFVVTYYDGVCKPAEHTITDAQLYAIVERRQHAVLHTEDTSGGTWVVLDYLGEIAVAWRKMHPHYQHR